MTYTIQPNTTTNRRALKAIRHADPESLSEALAQGADPNTFDKTRDMHLLASALSPEEEYQNLKSGKWSEATVQARLDAKKHMTRILIEAGAKPDLMDLYGRMPVLAMLAKYQSSDVVADWLDRFNELTSDHSRFVSAAKTIQGTVSVLENPEDGISLWRNLLERRPAGVRFSADEHFDMLASLLPAVTAKKEAVFVFLWSRLSAFSQPLSTHSLTLLLHKAVHRLPLAQKSCRVINLLIEAGARPDQPIRHGHISSNAWEAMGPHPMRAVLGLEHPDKAAWMHELYLALSNGEVGKLKLLTNPKAVWSWVHGQSRQQIMESLIDDKQQVSAATHGGFIAQNTPNTKLTVLEVFGHITGCGTKTSGKYWLRVSRWFMDMGVSTDTRFEDGRTWLHLLVKSRLSWECPPEKLVAFCRHIQGHAHEVSLDTPDSHGKTPLDMINEKLDDPRTHARNRLSLQALLSFHQADRLSRRIGMSKQAQSSVRQVRRQRM